MVVVGGFWGDEGKGKVISYLALKDQIDLAARVETRDPQYQHCLCAVICIWNSSFTGAHFYS